MTEMTYTVPTLAESYETQLAELRDKLSQSELRVQEAKDLHRSDIETLGKALIEEADIREWCAEYDTFVEDVNRKLTVELPVRERSYLVTVSTQITFRVTARDDDSAARAARELASDLEYDVDRKDDVSTSRWDSIHDYDVEEG